MNKVIREFLQPRKDNFRIQSTSSLSCRDHYDSDSDVTAFCFWEIVAEFRLGETCPRRLCSARISSYSSVIALETASAKLKCIRLNGGSKTVAFARYKFSF